MKMVIRGGRVIDPSQNIDGLFDILIEDNMISDISPSEEASFTADHVFDANNLVVMPGLIDMHTHLRDPGYEYKEDIESGTLAAAAGGITAVACMANTKPVNDNSSVTEDILKKADKYGHVKVYPIGAATKGLKGEELAEIGSMRASGIVAVSDDGIPIKSSEMMRCALEYCKTFEIPVISHAEDPHLSHHASMNEGYLSTVMGLKGVPNVAEDIMVMRDIALAELTGGKLHIAHISSKGAVSLVRDAKKRGVSVTAEAAPHHFTLTESAVEGYFTDAKMNPPLRTNTDVEAVREGLSDGTIDAIATDHAPHSSIEKDVEFECAANGIIGLETMLPLTLKLVDEGVLTLSEAIKKMTLFPASIMGIQGGTLKKGMAADITIADLNAEYIVDRNSMKSKSKNTPFHGWTLKGKAVCTIVDGNIVFNEERNG